MGRLKTPEITDDIEVLKGTIVRLMDVSHLRALDASVLLEAMTRLPFTTELVFDKIFGRWIFSNVDEDDWSKVMKGHKVSGPNFTFVELTPEMAVIKGIHYYYHTRIDQTGADK